MKTFFALTIICFVSALCATRAQAAADQYPGDTSIYGSQTVLDPNVLLIIDTSSSMTDPNQMVTGPGTYSKSQPYYSVTANCGTGWLDNCSSTGVYQVIQSSGTAPVYSFLTDISASTFSTSCNGNNPKSALSGSTGTYTGRMLNANGSCASTGTATYYYGNYINFLYSSGAPMLKLDVVKNVVDNLLKSTTGVRFGVMTYYYPTSHYYSNPGFTQYYGAGGTFLQGVPSGATATYTTTINDMDSIFQGTMTNRTALRRVVRSLYPPGNNPGVIDADDTPLGETLYEAGRYFSGGAPAFNATIGVSGGTYVSPAVPSCRNNYVVFLTDGMSSDEYYTSTPPANNFVPWGDSGVNYLKNSLGSMCTTGNPAVATADCDGDGNEPGLNDITAASLKCFDSSGNPISSCCKDSNGYTVSCTSGQQKYLVYDYSHALDDVAKYLNLGPQKIMTYTIGFGSQIGNTAVLQSASDNKHGNGAYYPATGQTDLTTTFNKIIANILAVDSSYVAPVVPVSPDNRTYGGSRVYMGFFKPMDNSAAWLGNLKKYGLDSSSNITGVDGKPATNSDGTFTSRAQSFWSTVIDQGVVNAGGAGALLQAKTNITTSRNIYTTASKTNGAGLVALNSSSVTTTLLNVPDSPTRTSLLNFVYGLDTSSTASPQPNRSWVMGDVLHSKPLIINYNHYTFCDPSNGVDKCGYTDPPLPTVNEQAPSTNRSRIFVGANDGMLHAFNDWDGNELWAFTPYDMLPNLQLLSTQNQVHSYFVDSTPSVYIYDAGNDGNLSTAGGDKVILMFGERRGGDQVLAHRAPIMFWM